MCKPFTGNNQKSKTAYLFIKKQRNHLDANFMHSLHDRLKFDVANIVFPLNK